MSAVRRSRLLLGARGTRICPGGLSLRRLGLLAVGSDRGPRGPCDAPRSRIAAVLCPAGWSARVGCLPGGRARALVGQVLFGPAQETGWRGWPVLICALRSEAQAGRRLSWGDLPLCGRPAGGVSPNHEGERPGWVQRWTAPEEVRRA
ncbi:hypothetical protein NDU88_010755 [Pleurodeles waltl]|uniref:Uncharacterized protein n=1 Tax=Pleurodeles waltl TaxID=8319 RepID=A0AAV7QY82_PLEWA|nr:hypothetical protein NDU88_010755 [Pleurodeles waltl]